MAENDEPLPEDVRQLQMMVRSQRVHIDHLKLLIAKLKRAQYGRSSEKLDREIEQLELQLEELQISQQKAQAAQAADQPQTDTPKRKPLPDHLPREPRVYEPDCSCPDCGGAMHKIGEDVSEMLEHVPEHFKVIRIVRPKLACAHCERIVQVAAPARPIAGGLA